LTAGDPGEIGARMVRCWHDQAGVSARAVVLAIDRQGTRLEEEE
jgi:hypothetical protein